MASSRVRMPSPPDAGWAAALARQVGADRGQAGLGDALAIYIEGDPERASATTDTEPWRRWAETAAALDGANGGWGQKVAATYYSAAQTVVSASERARLESWWGGMAEAFSATAADMAAAANDAARMVRNAGGGLSGALSLLGSPLTWIAVGAGALLWRRRA